MDCCEPEEQKELKKSEKKEDGVSLSETSDNSESEHGKGTKNILVWGGAAVVLIVGLLAWLL